MLTGRTPLLLLLLGSAGLLLGALGFQYIGDLTPCPLCHLQRYPHIVVVALMLIGLIAPRTARGWSWILLLAAVALAVTAGIGLYHAGVEYKWWAGPGACSGDSGFDPTKMDPTKLGAAIGDAPPARCDAIAWSFLGISMAAWNALISAALMVFALAASLRAFKRKAG